MYCTGMLKKTLLHKLDVIYHAAIRFVTGASFKTHHCHLYSLLNWSSLNSRRQINWFLLFIKLILGKLHHIYSHFLIFIIQVVICTLVVSFFFAYLR